MTRQRHIHTCCWSEDYDITQVLWVGSHTGVHQTVTVSQYDLPQEIKPKRVIKLTLILDASWRIWGQLRSRQGQCLKNAVILVSGTKVRVIGGTSVLNPPTATLDKGDSCHRTQRMLVYGWNMSHFLMKTIKAHDGKQECSCTKQCCFSRPICHCLFLTIWLRALAVLCISSLTNGHFWQEV